MDRALDSDCPYTDRCTPEPKYPCQDHGVFRTLFDRTCDAVLLLEENDARIAEVNPAALSMMRATGRDQLCGRRVADFAPASQSRGGNSAAAFREFLNTTQDKGSQRFEWEARRCDGTSLLLEIVLTLMDPGTQPQWVAFCRDITEKRRTMQALKDSEALHRALFDATRQGVTLHDDRAFFSANPAAVRILRLQCAEDIVGRHPSEISAPIQPCGQPSEVLARQHIADCLRDGAKRFEWLSRAADGKEFLMDVQLTAVDVGDRRIIQAVLDDISERKAAEAELRRALESEKTLSQLRASFVSMVSHEFRTPLSIIQSSSEILENYLDRMPADERLDHLRSIRKNTGRMAALMDEALFIGRLEAGKMDFRPMPIALDAFLERLVAEMRRVTAERCPLILKQDGSWPIAKADERLLQPILANLLTNAAKYSSAGSPVFLEAERHGQEAKFVVRDTGIGIPEADRDWLFQPFHRGQNVSNRPGTGLGLTIVRRCVDLHSGRLELQSTVGRGTAFTVWLPLFDNTSS